MTIWPARLPFRAHLVFLTHRATALPRATVRRCGRRAARSCAIHGKARCVSCHMIIPPIRSAPTPVQQNRVSGTQAELEDPGGQVRSRHTKKNTRSHRSPRQARAGKPTCRSSAIPGSQAAPRHRRCKTEQLRNVGLTAPYMLTVP